MTQKILIFVLLLVLALLGYKMLQPNNTTSNPIADVATETPVDAAFTSTDLDDIPPTYVDSDATSTSVSAVKPVLTSSASASASASSFTCDGRKHCSQMTSCAEATYFVQHCPNTKMDGNNDGIPCEQQWCR